MTLNLDTLVLDKGAHLRREFGVCLMEAVAWWAGEEHTDAPQCVSRVLAAFGRALNDTLPTDKRQQLVPLIPRLAGTRDDGLDKTRGYLALDWLFRTYTPAWLDRAGLATKAEALRNLPRIVDVAAVQAATPVLCDAEIRAAAARDAARNAASSVARPATRAAGRVVAGWAAARAAARYAGASADSDAAEATAWNAATKVVWACACSAAEAAAVTAARFAARDSAEAAARAALAPTVDQLQTSAIELYVSMIRPEVTP